MENTTITNNTIVEGEEIMTNTTNTITEGATTMTNTTTTNTNINVEQIKANIEGVEMALTTIVPNEANAPQIAMLQQQLETFKTMLNQATTTPAVDESSAADINNTNNEGEKATMENTTTTNTNTKVEASEEARKRLAEIKKRAQDEARWNRTGDEWEDEVAFKFEMLRLNKRQIETLEFCTKFAQERLNGHVKTLSQIIGSLESVQKMVIDTKTQKFVFLDKASQKPRMLPFGKTKGQELISLLAEFLPRVVSEDEAQYLAFKRIEKLNLINFKGINFSPTKTKKRDTAIVLNAVLQESHVVINGVVKGSFEELAKESNFAEMIFEDSDQPKFKEGVSFVLAKDLNHYHMNSIHSAYQKQSMSLALHKYANYKGMVKETIEVKTKVFTGALTYIVSKPVEAYVFDDLCFIDGHLNTSLTEEEEAVLLAAMFDNVQFINRENGVLKVGEKIDPAHTLNMRAYIRSVAQSRTKGGIALDSLDSAAKFLLATAMLDKAYAVKHEDLGKDSGWYEIDVDDASKRFFLGGASGQLATKGILSPKFIANCDVEVYQPGELHTFGKIEPAYVIFTHKKTGEKLTIALIKDFTTTISRGEKGENDFLINVLSKTNELLRLEEFKYWKTPGAEDILKLEITDGQMFHNGRVDKSLRQSKLLNRFSTFQFRMGIANKGCSLRADMICDYLKADMVLPKSTVKKGYDPAVLAEEVKQNGFMFYVVGQRKDGEDGLFVASQATQTYGFTEIELIEAYKASIAYVKKAMDTRNVSQLSEVLDIANEAQENEFATFDFLRIAKKVPSVLNEQYFKDEVASLIVKRMNQLLNSRAYAKHARSRYMFTDPIAIFNAIKRGSYEVIEEDKVLNHYEVIAPSIVDGKYKLEVGDAAATRFPCSVVHESCAVTAIYNEEFARYAEEYGWGGVVFFDAKSWAVQRMAGADFDGDSCILIFDSSFVMALKRTQSQEFAGLRVLPCIDVYVIEGGVGFGKGCPTFETEATKNKKKVEVKQFNDFIFSIGNRVVFNKEFLSGENEEANRFELAKAVASVANVKTIHSVESSLIGIIANQIMILTDVLTRNDLTPAEKHEIETHLLLLRTKGAWEIDRPKHGGAYLEMEVYVRQNQLLSPLFFAEEELGMSDERKKARLAQEKGAIRHAFKEHYVEINGEKVISGFSMKKPSWLASQKAEFGLYNDGSIYQKAYDFVAGELNPYTGEVVKEGALHALCNELATENKGQNNNILGLVAPKIKVAAPIKEQMKALLAPIYDVYSKRDKERSDREKAFKQNAYTEMKKNGAFARKDYESITTAVKNSKLRTNAKCVEALEGFKAEKEMLKGVLRKEVYEIAKNNGWDVRYLVGMLYILIKGMNTKRSTAYAPYRMDGREVRFVGAGSGNVSVCFEVFGEEMKSLLLDNVEETSFIPSDTNFVLIKDASLLPRYTVEVNVQNPKASYKGILMVNKMKPITITQYEGKPVINFLDPTGQIAMVGWSPVQASVGRYDVLVETIAFSSENPGLATVTFRA